MPRVVFVGLTVIVDERSLVVRIAILTQNSFCSVHCTLMQLSQPVTLVTTAETAISDNINSTGSMLTTEVCKLQINSKEFTNLNCFVLFYFCIQMAIELMRVGQSADSQLAVIVLSALIAFFVLLLLVLLTIVSGCVSENCHNLHDMMHRKYSLRVLYNFCRSVQKCEI